MSNIKLKMKISILFASIIFAIVVSFLVCEASTKGEILLKEDFQTTELEKHFAYYWLDSSQTTYVGMNVSEWTYDYIDSLCTDVNFADYKTYVILGGSNQVQIYLLSCDVSLAYSYTSYGYFCKAIYSADASNIPVYRKIIINSRGITDYGESNLPLVNKTESYYYEDLGFGNYRLLNTSCAVYDCIEFYDKEWNYQTMNYYYTSRCLTEGTNLNRYAVSETESSETINNHMYMLSCDVGFCGNKAQGDLSGFSSTYVYFDYALDKYALAHCDDYLLHINYRLNVDGIYYDYLYATGVSASQYFMQSLSDIKFNADAWVGSKISVSPLNGKFLEYQKQKLCVSDFKVCELTVTCYISGTTASLSSGQFVKRFDLISGQNYIDKNEIIENKNPYDDGSNSGSVLGGASVNQSNTQTVTFPNTLNVNINQGNNLPNVTIEDDDMSFSSLVDALKSGFGIIDDVDTGVKGDGFPAMLSYLYNGLPDAFTKIILLGVSSVTAIAILLRLFGRK